MGIYDRDYAKDKYSGGGFGGGGMGIAMPSLTPVVKWILSINVVVFIFTFMMPEQVQERIMYLFGSTGGHWWELLFAWKYVTYQFLHDTHDIFHLLFNMLGLYFFGTLLERTWGSRHFLKFYLICGAVGGVVYPFVVLSGALSPLPLIGASGAIYGIIAAVAILYPRVRVYVWGIFPIPMIALALIMLAFSLFALGGSNMGGQIAHLAGLATGAVWVYWKPLMQKMRLKQQHGKWTEKLEMERDFHREVDRILEKVHKNGISSLSRKEKKLLKRATEREQQQNIR